jgi:hypothetical protein
MKGGLARRRSSEPRTPLIIRDARLAGVEQLRQLVSQARVDEAVQGEKVAARGANLSTSPHFIARLIGAPSRRTCGFGRLRGPHETSVQAVLRGVCSPGFRPPAPSKTGGACSREPGLLGRALGGSRRTVMCRRGRGESTLCGVGVPSRGPSGGAGGRAGRGAASQGGVSGRTRGGSTALPRADPRDRRPRHPIQPPRWPSHQKAHVGFTDVTSPPHHRAPATQRPLKFDVLPGAPTALGGLHTPPRLTRNPPARPSPTAPSAEA